MVNLQEPNAPSLLITSGMHGDEYEVIALVRNYLTENLNKLPTHFYIPEASPSALNTKTRKNASGNDLNRSFFDKTEDKEALTIITNLKDQHFLLALDFHEDPLIHDFYMYDSGKVSEEDLKRFKDSLRKEEVTLFDGIDDPEDPVLGYKIDEGYASFADSKDHSMTGTFWNWALGNKVVKRMIVFEIPGQETLEKKRKIVETIFEVLLPKLY